MSAITDFIATLHTTAKQLEEEYLVNKIERDSDGKLSYIQYAGALDENAEPEHILEIDDAIRRALKMGWDPTDDRPITSVDIPCSYGTQSHPPTYANAPAEILEGEL